MKKWIRKLKSLGKTSEQAHMDYLIAKGLNVGSNFSSYSPYAFDANWPWLISVGNNVTFSTNVTILAHDASPTKFRIPTKVGIVRIGDNVFVGAGATILCDTRIGSNVIIGAGSVVSRDIPDNSVAAGNPARVICSIEEFKTKHNLLRKEKPYFNQHRWDQWCDAPIEDKEAMRRALEDGFGYV